MIAIVLIRSRMDWGISTSVRAISPIQSIIIMIWHSSLFGSPGPRARGRVRVRVWPGGPAGGGARRLRLPRCAGGPSEGLGDEEAEAEMSAVAQGDGAGDWL